MTIKTKYSIGQRVRFKWHDTVTKDEVCRFCSGQKIIIGHDGSFERCPHCKGKGFIATEYPGVNEGEGVISDIKIYCFKNNINVFYRIDWYWDVWFNDDAVLEVLE